MATRSVRLGIAGGSPLNTRGVVLYEEELIREATSLWHQAEAKVAPSGPQYGYLGSPAFVIGAATAASVLESWRKRRLDKEAAALTEAAAEKYEAALKTARFFPWRDWVHPEQQAGGLCVRVSGDRTRNACRNASLPQVVWKALHVVRLHSVRLPHA